MEFKFYGDLIIPDPPSSIEDAVKISKSIPKWCESSKKPVSFTIVPLKDYCGETDRILNQISTANVEKVSEILDNFEDMRLYMDRDHPYIHMTSSLRGEGGQNALILRTNNIVHKMRMRGGSKKCADVL